MLTDLHPVKEVKAFGAGRFLLQQILALSREIRVAERRQARRDLAAQTGLGALAAAVSLGGMALVVSAVFRGEITVGDVTLYLAAVSAVCSSARLLVAPRPP